MADQEDVRRIALTLPGAIEDDGTFAFAVEVRGKAKGFVWGWLERVHPRKARVPRDDVVAIRVIDEADKQALLAAHPEWCFTEPHYNGYPAVLVRLPEVPLGELEELLVDGWRVLAPKALVEAWAEGRADEPS